MATNRTLPVLALLLVVTTANAQDPNWSLPYATPGLINPAMTGVIEGDYRFLGAHRWRKATITESFHTSILSVDGRIDNRVMRGGLGALVATDGLPGLRTNQLQLFYAYEAPLGIRVRYDHLRVGFQAGLLQRTLDMDKLIFEDQFDGIGGFNRPTQESMPRLTQFSPDVSMGMLWYRTQKIRGNPELNPFLGFAVQHLNRPNLGFYRDLRERATMRYTFQGGFKFATRSAFEIHLNTIYAIQNHSQQVTLNLFTRLLLFDNGILFGRHNSSVMLGTTIRFNDVAAVYTGFEFKKKYAIGFGFDIYTSRSLFTRNAYGGIHTMFTYIVGTKRFRDPSIPFPFF